MIGYLQIQRESIVTVNVGPTEAALTHVPLPGPVGRFWVPLHHNIGPTPHSLQI